ncbi:MAG: class I SAM-dependent methyltransferase [Rickettsiales bacterium TMED254]|nr:MAG: class I SAM-dependent methyltransferase [Rickettsiales bacterium TMED254]
MSLTFRNICPACKKNNLKNIYSLSYNSEKMINFLDNYYKERIDTQKLEKNNYNLLECQYCSLIFQEQIPDEKFSQELYEELIDQEDSLQKKENFEKKYRKKLFYEISLIKGMFKKKNKEISILDFGAGWGFWLNHLKSYNFDVYAYEISQSRIEFIKKNQINVISSIENSVNKFDFIYSEETFEHISNPKETLINLSKMLKNEGFILLRFPSSFLFKFKLNEKYKPGSDCAHPLEHINLLKKKSFNKMTEDSNLKIINFKSQFSFSVKNFLKDIKNFFYFDSILLKKINK